MQKEIKIYNLSLKLSVLAIALCMGALAVFLSDIIENYSLVGAQEGLMSSMISAGAFIALISLVLLQGRFKKPSIIIVCGFLTAAMSAALGLVKPFTLFLLFCLLMGFNSGAVDSNQSAFLADLNPKDTAKHMGALHGIFGLGSIITPIFLHALLAKTDWRTIYLIIGGISFLIFAQFAVVTAVIGPKVSVAGRKESKLTLSGLKAFFSEPYMILALGSIFFGAAAQSGVIVWTIRYVSVFLQNPELAPICLSVFWVTSTISRFAAPQLPLKPNQILAFGALIAGVAWGIALIVDTPWVVCIACAVAGLAAGPCIPMSLSEGASVNLQGTGMATSILMIFKTIAQILSPIILAFIMSLSSMQTGMFVTCIFFFLNFVVAFMMIRRSKFTAPLIASKE